MPHPTKFLESFGLEKGDKIRGYEITYAHANHKAVLKHHKWIYHIDLKFKPTDGKAKHEWIYEAVMKKVDKKKRIVEEDRKYTAVIHTIPHEAFTIYKNGSIKLRLYGSAMRVGSTKDHYPED